jgi:hypothetical protein
MCVCVKTGRLSEAHAWDHMLSETHAWDRMLSEAHAWAAC